jgi:hypothetical protein
VNLTSRSDMTHVCWRKVDPQNLVENLFENLFEKWSKMIEKWSKIVRKMVKNDRKMVESLIENYE